jgi:hypothetical protein
MWNCLCGVKNVISHFCPTCGRDKPVPHATTSGPSDANALPGEPGYIASTAEEEEAAAAVAGLLTPAEEADQQVSKAELKEALAKEPSELPTESAGPSAQPTASPTPAPATAEPKPAVPGLAVPVVEKSE